MFEALVILVVVALLVAGIGAAVLKTVTFLVLLPFKLLAGLVGGVLGLAGGLFGLVGGLLGLLVLVPVGLGLLALVVALVPIGLVLFVLALPLLLIGALVAGLCAL